MAIIRSAALIALVAVVLWVGTRRPAAPPGALAPPTPRGPGRFVDHGDGTATDTTTGLTWELKVEGLGCLHCIDDKYTWSTGTNNPDGTAFTVFLDRMNNTCDGDDTTRCVRDEDCTGIGNGLCGHTGLHDWRLPTEAEITTLLLEPYECFKNPCVDPAFPGVMKGHGYWTSTPDRRKVRAARGVFMSNSFAGSGPKQAPAYARAVRGPNRDQ
jgi:hypothetical protein